MIRLTNTFISYTYRLACASIILLSATSTLQAQTPEVTNVFRDVLANGTSGAETEDLQNISTSAPGFCSGCVNLHQGIVIEIANYGTGSTNAASQEEFNVSFPHRTSGEPNIVVPGIVLADVSSNYNTLTLSPVSGRKYLRLEVPIDAQIGSDLTITVINPEATTETATTMITIQRISFRSRSNGDQFRGVVRNVTSLGAVYRVGTYGQEVLIYCDGAAYRASFDDVGAGADRSMAFSDNQVSFGGSEPVPAVWVNLTGRQLRAVLPNDAQTGDIQIWHRGRRLTAAQSTQTLTVFGVNSIEGIENPDYDPGCDPTSPPAGGCPVSTLPAQRIGGILTLRGSGLELVNQVTFLGVPDDNSDDRQATPISTSDTEIQVRVPSNAVGGQIRVNRSSNLYQAEDVSEQTFEVIPLEVTDVSPRTQSAGRQITIEGRGFSGTPAENTVTFAGGATATPISSTPTALVVVVPNNARVGNVSVAVTDGGTATSSVSFTPLRITTVRVLGGNDRQLVGRQIRIIGRGFDLLEEVSVIFLGAAGDVDNVTVDAADLTVSGIDVLLRVPINVQTGRIRVSGVDAFVTSSSAYTIPALSFRGTEFFPSAAIPGAELTILSEGIAGEETWNQVAFDLGGTQDAADLTWVPINDIRNDEHDGKRFTVDVPSGLTVGQMYTIRMRINDGTTTRAAVASTNMFTVTDPALVGQLPRVRGFRNAADTTITISTVRTGQEFAVVGHNFDADGSDGTPGMVTFIGTLATSDDNVVATDVDRHEDKWFTVTVPEYDQMPGVVNARGGRVQVETGIGVATSSNGLNVIPFYVSIIGRDHDNSILTSLEPITRIREGDEIFIEGRGFSTLASDNVVTFGGGVTAAATDAQPKNVGDQTAFLIRVQVPEGALSGHVTVTVGGVATPLSAQELIVLTLSDVRPYRQAIGGEIELIGRGFSSNARVTFLGGAASSDDVDAETVSVSDDGNTLTVVVPPDVQAGRIRVAVSGAGNVTSAENFVPIAITSVFTTQGTVAGPGSNFTIIGGEMWIRGTGFTSNVDDHTVIFFGADNDSDGSRVDLDGDEVIVNLSGITTLNAGIRTLKFQVPIGARTGRVAVNVNTGTSESPSFGTVIAPYTYRIDPLAFRLKGANQFEPTQATVGTEITLYTNGASFIQGWNEVSFDGGSTWVDASRLQLENDGTNSRGSRIYVIVPDVARTGTISIRLNDGTDIEGPVTSTQEFNVLPTLTSFQNTDGNAITSARTNQEIVLVGSGFDVSGDNRVVFTGAAGDADDVETNAGPASLTTRLGVRVPAYNQVSDAPGDNPKTGPVRLVTDVGDDTSDGDLTIIPFYISDVQSDTDDNADTPDESVVGATIRVENVIKLIGKGFSTTLADNVVTFVGELVGGSPTTVDATPSALNPADATALDTLVVTIPTAARAGVITVTTEGASVSSGSVMIEPIPNNVPVFGIGVGMAYELTIDEHTATGTALSTLPITATDDDADDVLTYTLRSLITPPIFEVVQPTDATGRGDAFIRILDGARLDYEDRVLHSLTVHVTDGQGGSDQRAVQIMLQDIEEPPAFEFSSGESSYTFEVAENAVENTEVGTVRAIDPDVGASVSYTITGGTGMGKFKLVDVTSGSQIQVEAAAELDYDAPPNSYTLDVTATSASLTDPLMDVTTTTTVTINLLDENEAPFFYETNLDNVMDSYTATMDEQSEQPTMTVDPSTLGPSDATQVATLTASDPEGEDITYSFISGGVSTLTDGPFLLVSEPTQAVISAYVELLDYEAEEEHTLTVRAEVATGEFEDVTLTVTLGNVNDNRPLFTDEIGGSTTSYTFLEQPEPVAASTALGSVYARDRDGDLNTVTLTVSDTRFEIEATRSAEGTWTGSIKNKAEIDYETSLTEDERTAGGVIELEVQASDGVAPASTTTVSITIVNVNEGAPVFDETSYDFSVNEDAAAGDVIGTVSATEPDGEALSYSLTAASDKFEVGSTSGEISLKAGASLDLETATNLSIYVLRVQASDGTNDAEVEVTINVGSVNEFSPVFGESLYVFSVDEGSGSSTSIGTIAATDEDHASTLTYILTVPITEFAINDVTGEITVTDIADLDFEGGTTSYTLTAQASDGDNDVSTIINISVNDVNEAPVFDAAPYNFAIEESATLSTVVGTPLSAVDEDASDTPIFSFVDGAGSSTPITSTIPFEIGASTGQITVSGPLDRETESSYTLYVLASDRAGSTLPPVTAEVTITVGDVDEPPEVSVTLSTNIPASGKVDADYIGEVAHVTATDPEGQALTYGLDAGSHTSSFSVSTGGLVRKEADIPYADLSSDEQTNGIMLTASVTDGTTPEVTEDFVIRIQNPDAPAFTLNTYNFTQAENASVGSPMTGTPISATNPSNSTLTYSFVTSDTRFSIDGATGAITNAEMIDYEGLSAEEQTNGISLTVRVSDGTDTDEARVVITIEDVNEPPTISVSSYTFTHAENEAPGTRIGEVVVEDPEGNLTYNLMDPGNTNTSPRFAIDVDGLLTNAIAIDYESLSTEEQRDGVMITVEASDGNASVTATVTITITDVDEVSANPPAFGESSYSFTQAENTVVGTEIGTVTATDADGGSISYSLTNTGGNRFLINRTTGAITNAVLIDYEALTPTEQSDGIEITVKASDGADTQTATVTITITDVDEAANPPVFGETSYSFTQAENTPANTAIGTVTATDADGGSISYSLTNTGGDRFAINSTTGAITNAVLIDYESLSTEEQRDGVMITVEASDGNTSVTATVTITITDVDEGASNQPPVFGETSYSFTQAENTAANTAIGTVTATDSDGGSISYRLTNTGGDRFAINSTTGAITNAVVIDYEALSTAEQSGGIEITVEASDGTDTQTVSVTITITDVDEGASNQPPVFGETSYSFTQAENTAANTAIGTVTATDSDGGSISYRLTNTGGDRFAINSTTGAITNAVLIDYEALSAGERRDGIEIMVEASDGTDTQTVSVTITITDVDEGAGDGLFHVTNLGSEPHLYPNPASSTLWFADLAPTREYVYGIYTLLGQEVSSGVVRGAVDLKDLPDGQYIVILRDESGGDLLRSQLLIVR